MTHEKFINDPYPEENVSGNVCPSCLSDHLPDKDICTDGLCKDCTNTIECERCGTFCYPEDMAEDFCIDCLEFLEREKKEVQNTQERLSYGY